MNSKRESTARRVGILGGGQLGKMLALAAGNWHLPVHILDESPDFPAPPFAAGFVPGRFNSYEDVYRFGKTVDVLTIEIEHVHTGALKALQAEGLWDPATMVVVLAGPAQGAYANTLQRLAERLGITASLHWTGMLQGDQKWGAFQSADAFVLPSHQENFGIAVVEALSCSTPVLLTHPVNIAADIAAAGAGLVEDDTPAGITTLLRRWLALDPTDRAAMATAARRCFLERYEITNDSLSITRTIHAAILQRKLAQAGG